MTRKDEMFFELNIKEEIEKQREDFYEAKEEALRTIVRSPREFKRMFLCEFTEDHHDGH